MPPSDIARSVAFNENAPEDERRDARAELERSTMPRAMSDLIPNAAIQPVIDFIMADLEEQAISKALGRNNVIPFPSQAAQNHRRGMQSVYLDELQITLQGDYYEKPGVFGFDSMRMMVDQTPQLSAVIITRLRQVSEYCHVNTEGKGPGFKIGLKDRAAQPNDDDKQAMAKLESFFTNCGWESRPRSRMRLKRQPFAGFMAKLVRDSLTMDSAPIETEWKRDKSLGLDGLYAVDGATIRLCSEEGYQGDDEIYALQVVQGQIRAAYTYEDMVYVPRNPRSDILVGGYGFAETELLVRTVTGLLNAFTYNTKYFDSNAIPKGILNLFGNFSETDISAFKRYWNTSVKGVNNAWALPVMVSKDAESKAQYEHIGNEVNEVMFSKWMVLLTSLICAIYSIAPEEINFESFSAGASALSGKDTEEKLVNSKDKGLKPLLRHFQAIFNDYVVAEYGEKYTFYWTGFDDEDAEYEQELDKLTLSVNEVRARRNDGDAPGTWGDAPLNPALVASWQAEQQAQQQQEMQDFGQPGQPQPGAGGPDADFGQGADGGGDFGEMPGGGAGGGPPGQVADQAQEGDEAAIAKAFGLPVYTVN